jgi:hypothetical protein
MQIILRGDKISRGSDSFVRSSFLKNFSGIFWTKKAIVYPAPNPVITIISI